MLEILISSTALIIVICCIRAFWKGKINLHLQYALWLLVVIRLFPLGIFLGAELPKIESPVSIMNSFEHISGILPNFKTSTHIDNNWDANPADIDNSYNSEDEARQQSISQNQNSILENRHNIVFAKKIVTTIWYVGMVLSALWIVYINMHLRRTIKKERRLLKNIECKLPVYVSSNIDTPLLLVINGKLGIYVTPACENNEIKMKHALTHELCHYKHFDHIWSFIRCILLVIYWFNPFIWLAAILSKRDCELSCDVAALKILGEEERFIYGRTILELVTKQKPFNQILNASTGMSENSSGMKERIQRIVKKPKMMTITFFIIMLIIFTITIITFTTSPNQNSKDASELGSLNLLSNDKIVHADDDPLTTDPLNEDVNPPITAPFNENDPFPTTDSSNEELKNLLDSAKNNGFNSGYYFTGDTFMTPNGPIEDLSEFTNDIIINKYFGKSVRNEKDSLITDGFSKSFGKLDGISYWLTLTASEESTIDIDYTTTATDTTLKTLLILPDGNVCELKNGESNVISLPKGVSEIVIVALGAEGNTTIKFNNLTEHVDITTTK